MKINTPDSFHQFLSTRRFKSVRFSPGLNILTEVHGKKTRYHEAKNYEIRKKITEKSYMHEILS